MAYIDASQLLITRSGTGTWRVGPRPERAWRTPVTVESVRDVYGSGGIGLDFSGAFGRAQRFRATVGIINVKGFSGMDGLLQAMFDEVGTVKPFEFEWPQLMETETSGSPTLNADIGDGATSFTVASNPLKVGRLFTFNKPRGRNKLHRVVRVSSRTIHFFPASVEAVKSGVGVVSKPVTDVVMTRHAQATINRGVVLETVLTVQERLS